MPATPLSPPSSRLRSRWRAALSGVGRWQPWWVATVAIALLVGWADPLLHRAEALAYDLTVGWIGHGSDETDRTAARQVVVAIDDASLQRLGPWPWTPAQHAALIDQLTEAGARTVGYDVPLQAVADTDATGGSVLAAAIARHGRVVLPVSLAHPGTTAGAGPDTRSDPVLRAAAGLGHTALEPDRDGLVRSHRPIAAEGDRSWPSMPVAVAQVEAGQRSPWAAGTTDATADAIGASGPPIEPWALRGDVLVPPMSAPLKQLSAEAVLRDPAARAALHGAVVWVGVTAEALGPTLASPVAGHVAQMAHGAGQTQVVQPVDGTGTMGTAPPDATAGGASSGVAWQAVVFDALQRGTLVHPLNESVCHALNLAPLLLFALLQQWRPRRLHGHGLWLLPLPTLLGAMVLALAHVWMPTVGLTVGLVIGWLLTRSRDLSGARQALQAERSQADATLQAITDSVITVDTEHRIRYLNPSAERLAGAPLAALRGAEIAQALAWDAPDAQTLCQALSECMQQRRVVTVGLALRLRTPLGERLVQLIASPIHGRAEPAGAAPHAVTGAVLALSDVTETHRSAQLLQHEASHDALTGLPNRALMGDRLQQAALGAQAGSRQVAVLFIDLDRFKRINDSLGHRQGDTVLKVVAERLAQCCRAHDTLARWGGDEFVVLLEGVSSREVVAARAAQMVEAVAREFWLDQIEVTCGCSIGVAMAPQDAVGVDGLCADALMAMADTAMYRAKVNGGKRVEFYASEAPAWTRERLALETRLRHSLGERSFVLHYQPQVDLKTGRLIGLEALLRWRQADGELWAPARFLPVTEETGLILPIGEWVIREATAQLARWREQGLPLVPVSVNVSTRQCLDHRLVQVVTDALRDSAVPASLLKLEITESTAMADLGQLRQLLARLRELGVQVAMDDFGTGFSSLSHLKNVHVDQIKIDPSFVRDIHRSANGAAIVRATIALAHALGLPVVAEGVESEEQMYFLTEHDCDFAQGYLYSRAQDADVIGDLLRDRLAQGRPLHVDHLDLPTVPMGLSPVGV